jgi:two-component system LytT family response regulator
MKVRAIIADDEPLARERLRNLLSAEPRIELVCECSNGQEALDAIQGQAPDLVFLDVQMPELDGFAVLAELEPNRRPLVIFVTAHDKFALRAFEVHAIDYLLKPFDRQRFQTALQRALNHLQQHDTKDLKDRLSALLKDVRTEPKHAERIAIKSSGKVIFLKTSEVNWVEAADNYVNLHVGSESHLHRETMSALEEILDPSRFMRISRSTMVNVDCIKELQPLFHGEYSVILKDGTRLTLSRGYREKLQQLLGKFG